MNRDALTIQYNEIREQMQGISPKLALYAELKRQLTELEKKMGGMRPPPAKVKDQKRHKGTLRYFSGYQHRG